MKIRISLLLVILLALHPLSTAGMSSDQWNYIDGIANQTLMLTKEKEYDKAYTLLEHFSSEFTTINNDFQLVDNHERVLKISFEDAKKALLSDAMSHDARVNHVMQFRFAVDALYSAYQPLWIEMERTVMGSFAEMKESLAEGNHNGESINEFIENVNIIYPSLVIDLNSEQIEKLNSHIAFLEQYKTGTTNEQMVHLEMLEKDLVTLFHTLHMNEKDPSFIWVTISITSVIFITLFYVAWKKYRGGNEVVNV